VGDSGPHRAPRPGAILSKETGCSQDPEQPWMCTSPGSDGQPRVPTFQMGKLRPGDWKSWIAQPRNSKFLLLTKLDSPEPTLSHQC
jgi:hypothetical protein